jgi:hypothetical protein
MVASELNRISLLDCTFLFLCCGMDDMFEFVTSCVICKNVGYNEL